MATNTRRAYTPAGLFAASGGIVCWAAGNIIVKLTTSPFLIVSFYRHLFSLPVLFVGWRLLRDRTLPWRAAGLGGVLFATHQIFHLSSLRYSTIAVVTILFSLQPILVGAASHRFVGERTTVRFYLWSLVAIVGCTVVVVASSGQPGATPVGTLLAVSNLVAWSAYYLATKRARADYGTIPWLLVMTLVSGTIIGTLALVTGRSFASPSAHEFGLFLALAIPSATLGHFLVTWAQPRIHVAASSALILGVPIFSALGAALFLHEHFGPWHVAGALLAIGGAGSAMRHLPPPVTEEAAERFGEVAT
jgi:drug/metabolite transporter (DMT)-like permease